MANYYVKDQGASIAKQGERLVVAKGNQVIAYIPLHQLDQLTLMGNVQITTQAMAQLLQTQIDVVFMTQHGRVRGRLVANESKFAELRLKQLQVMSDPAANLALARQIVLGKLHNQLAVLQTANAPDAPKWLPEGNKAIQGINDMAHHAAHCDNAESLRGYEGKAATYYWQAFRRLLRHDMGFTGRQYRPAPDPVNALLSFGYALLQKDVTAAIQMVGLDAHIGFFHTVQYGRPSLALDLMETFRPWVVDLMVLDLLHTPNPPIASTALIQTHDFTHEASPERPLVLKETALRKVIEAYEKRMATRVYYAASQEQATLRRCVELQTRQLARVIKGEATIYIPYQAEDKAKGSYVLPIP